MARARPLPFDPLGEFAAACLGHPVTVDEVERVGRVNRRTWRRAREGHVPLWPAFVKLRALLGCSVAELSAAIEEARRMRGALPRDFFDPKRKTA